MANMSWGVNILPKVNNTYTLGNSDYKWNIFVNKINNQSVEGFGLPTITSADEGKILKVDSGAWAMTSDLKLTNGDLILATTLSKGRKENTTIGTDSIAFGTDVTASGECSQAFGGATVASGNFSFASGIMTNASGFGSHAEGIGIHNSNNIPNPLYGARGLYSHVEGYQTSAYRQYTHAQGYYSDAVGVGAHAEGYWGGAYGKFTHAGGVYGYAYGDGSFSHGLYTQAHGEGSYALGSCNVVDISFTAWEANHQYAVGDIVWHYGTGNEFGERAFDEHGFHYYKCKTANSDATFDITKWDEHVYGKFIETIGNGAYDWENETELYFSNARALDWQGNEYLNGDLYVNCENDSTGGSKVATESYVTTALSNVIIPDIQINSVSIVNNGVANVPYATSSTPGVITLGAGLFTADGKTGIDYAGTSQIQGGTSTAAMPVVRQHLSTFYGLAKAAGSDEKNSTLPVGQYTDAAKAAIQKMLGIYEAPWELIREDTFTNDTEDDHVISVDGNGEAFELTDVRMMIESPQQETAFSIGDYGRIMLHYSPSSYHSLYIGAYTQPANDTKRYSFIRFEQKDGMFVKDYVQNGPTGNLTSPVRTVAQPDGYFGTTVDGRSISKITIRLVTGTMHYKLYGKRKWR